MQIIDKVMAVAEKTPGLSQYAIKKYAEAFEVIPRTLAESAGLDATEVLARLYTAHNSYQKQQSSSSNSKKQTESSSEEDSPPSMGVDIENEDGTGMLDAEEEGILDLMVSKSWAIKLATESVRTILSVDQIIVARQAGGPKPPGPNPNWDED
jgi:T-complex protein 1 subunit theta